jgi:hypothetical protein
MFRSMGMGEEGLDYINLSKEVQDPNLPSTKLLER